MSHKGITDPNMEVRKLLFLHEQLVKEVQERERTASQQQPQNRFRIRGR
jgi:hypothetical protein